MRVWLCVAMVVLGTSPIVAQQDDPLPRPRVTLPDTPPPTFKTNRVVVTVDAVVTDRDGRHVTDLTRDDFEVTVAGKRQQLQQAIYIRTAEQARLLAAVRSPVPATAQAGGRSSASLALKRTGVQPDRIARTIALVVDDSSGSRSGAPSTPVPCCTRYINTQLEPGDLVAIIRTGGGTGRLQQFTTDVRLLHRAADGVQWNFQGRPQVSSFLAVEPTGLPGSVTGSGPRTAPSSGPRTRADAGRDTDASDLRDAVASVGSLGALEYIARGVAELPGRKCIVFISEGFTQLFVDRGESGRIWRAMSRMLGQANAAGVVLYTIDARAVSTGGLRAEDNPQQMQTGNEGTYDAEALVRNTAREPATTRCSIRRSRCGSSPSRPAASRLRTRTT